MTPTSLEIIAAFLHGPRTCAQVADYAQIGAEMAKVHIKQMHERGLVYVQDWARPHMNVWAAVYALQPKPYHHTNLPRPAKYRCPERQAWSNMHSRGCQVAPEWTSYARFVADVGPKPSRAHRLHRLDPSKPFGPGNGRWMTGDER